MEQDRLKNTLAAVENQRDQLIRAVEAYLYSIPEEDWTTEDRVLSDELIKTVGTRTDTQNGFMTTPCHTCDEGCGVLNECPGSKRNCGHHCNCLWIHDACCWCDVDVTDDGNIVPPTKPKNDPAEPM